MLIHGQAGSGKSTIARKIEEYLWDIYDKNIASKKWEWVKKDSSIAPSPEQIPTIPISVSLPSLKNPLDDAVRETLKSDNYRFDDRQFGEF
jgi:ABC-type phosphate/phosphonate transport system ATPase subunit